MNHLDAVLVYLWKIYIFFPSLSPAVHPYHAKCLRRRFMDKQVFESYCKQAAQLRLGVIPDRAAKSFDKPELQLSLFWFTLIFWLFNFEISFHIVVYLNTVGVVYFYVDS